MPIPPARAVADVLQVAVLLAPADVAETDTAPFVVQWGDGATSVVNFGADGLGSVVHDYAAPGDYTLILSGVASTGEPVYLVLDLTLPADTTPDGDLFSPPGIPGELPPTGPATLAGAKAQGSVSAAHDVALSESVAAVNAQVRTWPTAERSRGLPAWWAPTVRGANMLAVRLWRRKDTPGGVEVYGDFGIAYVRRLDPDVAQLLELGDWSKPGVG